MGAWSLVPVPPLTLPGYVPLTVQAGSETLTLNVPVFAGSFESVNIPAATAGPILSQQQKVAAETAAMGKLFARFTAEGWTPRSRFAPPLDGEFRHSSPFGSRRTYGNNPALSAHAGEDYSAAAGTPVYAPAAGKVVLAEPLFVRGNAIVLDHGRGVFTGYWHLSELAVEPGEAVETGQLIGKVGSTGLSTGAHLHWEMRVSGIAVDPLQWVK
jgi:murein DD-endopeptidase MepM/ murein hydrolase activator NlpD